MSPRVIRDELTGRPDAVGPADGSSYYSGRAGRRVRVGVRAAGPRMEESVRHAENGSGSHFSVEQLTEVRRLVDDSPAGRRNQVRGILMTGSIAAGLGHAQSDIDVIVVTDEPDRMSALNYIRADRRIDLLPVGLAELAALVGQGNRFTATRTSRSQVMMEHTRAMTVVRASTVEVLIADDAVRSVLGGVDHSELARILMTRAAIETATYTEDVAGMVEIGDWYTALDTSELALRKACDVFLTASRDFYISDKFLFRRVFRTPGLADVRDSLWTETHRGLTRSESVPTIRTAVHRRLQLASDLVSSTLLDGWDEPPSVLPPRRVRPAGPVRCPYFSLLRFTDGFALSGPNVGFEISSAGARAWSMLDGRPVPEVAVEFARTAAVEPADVADAIGAGIAEMVAQGAAYVGPLTDGQEGVRSWISA